MIKNIFILLLSFISLEISALENPTILYLGDSHSYGKLGTVIEKYLVQNSSRVIMESSCGATPSTWLGNLKYEKTICGFWKKDGNDEIRSKEHQTPKLQEELLKYHPDITIVQLGTNIAAGARPSKSLNSIIEVMRTIKAAKSACIWIGPPDANSKIVTKEKLIETNQLIKKISIEEGCSYINSLVFTQFPKDNKEGIHYPPSLSAEWGEKVSLELLKIISAL